MLDSTLKPADFFAILLHDIIREISLKLTFSQTFSMLCCKSFCIAENVLQANLLKMNSSYLKKVADLLYELDKQEKTVTSCYSVALTIFYIAASKGLDPYLVIGVRKMDKKLLGHAWIELSEKKEVINP